MSNGIRDCEATDALRSTKKIWTRDGVKRVFPFSTFTKSFFRLTARMGISDAWS